MQSNKDANAMRVLLLSLCAGLILISGSVEKAQADMGVKLGVLRCQTVEGTGVNLLIHSVTGVQCQYYAVDGTPGDRYTGETGVGLGLDLDWNKADDSAFTVFGASADVVDGSFPLAGKYIGAKASASASVGGGAAVLVGAGDNHFTLQPLALEGSKGWGIAAGAGYLFLKPGQ